jgi:hypothetical protein
MADFDYTGYNQRKRAATGSYGAKAAQNAYAQFLSQQRGARKKFDIQQDYEKKAPRVVSSFAKRGLAGPGVTSGVYERGLQEFGQQNLRDLSDLANSQDEEMNQLRLQDAQNRADYDMEIAQLEAEKQASIAQAAATLTAFKPFLS